MGLVRYGISFIAVLIYHYMFNKKASHKKWYTCTLAVIFILFTIFTLDFTFTTVFEREPQAAFVSFLLFGIADLMIFAAWRFSPLIAEKLSKQSSIKGEDLHEAK
ncbi:MAG: hypothetical protein FWG77_06415 [Treponema sp.]|nr:hypothetical protein [Treponema sp.]